MLIQNYCRRPSKLDFIIKNILIKQLDVVRKGDYFCDEIVRRP